MFQSCFWHKQLCLFEFIFTICLEEKRKLKFKIFFKVSVSPGLDQCAAAGLILKQLIVYFRETYIQFIWKSHCSREHRYRLCAQEKDTDMVMQKVKSVYLAT